MSDESKPSTSDSKPCHHHHHHHHHLTSKHSRTSQKQTPLRTRPSPDSSATGSLAPASRQQTHSSPIRFSSRLLPRLLRNHSSPSLASTALAAGAGADTSHRTVGCSARRGAETRGCWLSRVCLGWTEEEEEEEGRIDAVSQGRRSEDAVDVDDAGSDERSREEEEVQRGRSSLWTRNVWRSDGNLKRRTRKMSLSRRIGGSSQENGVERFVRVDVGDGGCRRNEIGRRYCSIDLGWASGRDLS
jgi:hypothetical protein